MQLSKWLDPDVFTPLFCCEYLTPCIPALYRICLRYVVESALFDRRVCDQFHNEYALPSTREQYTLVNEHAKEFRNACEEEANRLGFSKEEFGDMLREVNRGPRSINELISEYRALININ